MKKKRKRVISDHTRALGRAAQKRYVERRPERKRERDRKYWLDNKIAIEERRRNSKVLYRKLHKPCREAIQAWRQRRRGLKVKALGHANKSQILARVVYYGWRCRYCRCTITVNTLTIDHAIPLSRGGTNWPSNLMPSCKTCNLRKHTKTLSEFLGAR